MSLIIQTHHALKDMLGCISLVDLYGRKNVTFYEKPLS